MAHLLLITNCFPYSGYTENAFIQPEIEVLSNTFDSVTIIPDHIEEGHINQLDLDNIKYKLDCEYMFINKGKTSLFHLLKYLLHMPVIKAIIKDRKSISSRLKLYSLLSYYHNAYTFKRWIESKYLRNNNLDYLVYTFWFHANTTGIALLPLSSKVRCVTRAHRYDIFDDQVIFRSHYLRNITLSRVESVYACSHDGATYIRNNYPTYANKVKVAYLGTIKLYDGYAASNENVNKLTFLSCSRMHPIKRVPLICKYLSSLASYFPDIEVEWIHIGDGEEKCKVEEEISRVKLTNFNPKLIGALSNSEAQKFFLKKPIDWFISLSSSEGLPISICEALSYGVPVIATDVGGVSEIVNSNVGVLLQEPITIESFMNNMLKYIDDKNMYRELQTNAIKYWKQSFNAKKLREDFAKEIYRKL